MAFIREVDMDLDTGIGIEDRNYIGGYDNLFSEEEFRALGLDPSHPTPAKPGSEDKVTMLAARYAAGLPLWHTKDCYDHGPDKLGDGLEAGDLFDDEL
ncbi:MAG: hypothetical protein ACREJB_18215 [Planctomycetaceae bacterium]